MNEKLSHKLLNLTDRHQEIEHLLGESQIIADQDQFRKLSQEYAQLEPIIKAYAQYQQTSTHIADNRSLLEDDDADIKEMAQEELNELEKQLERESLALQTLLLPTDPHDGANVFLEIRAGTGGDEAAIFVGDLLKMYLRFADNNKWASEIITAKESDHGGYKEVIIKINGKKVYSQLKFESGAHRVQRVPETESQGRVHTSACTVAVLPEILAVEEIDINKQDLRIDTFRASGAGGQHVNKTDSAIRITHIPTGIVVECQEERSQHKNKAKAMSYLQSKLLSSQQEQQHQEQSATRKSLVGSGDRSERIRTYNYPQGRVTDHRINLTLYKLDEIMQGKLESVVAPLVHEHQLDQLSQLKE
jgi:peptide chain release factor 1